MARTPVIVAAEDRPQSLQVMGALVTPLVSSEQTGSFEVMYDTGPEGVGPDPHSHPWDEAFYLLRGELAMSVGGIDRTVSAGTLVFIPGGTEHSFKIGAGGAEMIGVTSHAGAVAMFTEIARNHGE